MSRIKLVELERVEFSHERLYLSTIFRDSRGIGSTFEAVQLTFETAQLTFPKVMMMRATETIQFNSDPYTTKTPPNIEPR